MNTCTGNNYLIIDSTKLNDYEVAVLGGYRGSQSDYEAEKEGVNWSDVLGKPEDLEGYGDEEDPTVPSYVKAITSSQITEWDKLKVYASKSSFLWSSTSATPDNLNTYYSLGYNVRIDGYFYFRNVLENTGGVSVAGYHDKMYNGPVYSFAGEYGDNSQFKHDIIGGIYARGTLTGGNWYRAWTDYDISQQTVNRINKSDGGSFTPTVTTPSGVSATVSNFIFSRNIDYVSFSGFVELSGLTPASDHTLYMTLPVLTVFVGTKQLLGSFNIHEGALSSNIIISSDSNKCKFVVYVPSGATTLKFAIQGAYQIQ